MTVFKVDNMIHEINWYERTIFYILDINGMVKFGITSNWENRFKSYKREIPDLKITLLKQETFDSRWKAELLEQIIKWRLRPWCVYGRHEWINLPVQVVFSCYFQTKEILSPEFEKHKHIHLQGDERWDFYRQLAEMQFDKL